MPTIISCAMVPLALAVVGGAAARAAQGDDGMTVDVYPFDTSFLSQCATRIVSDMQGINRVVHGYASKPQGTIAWERARSELCG